MLVQIYETSSADEAAALRRIGVDHIGVLVGNGAYPRKQSIEAAKRILRAVLPPSKESVLCLSADIGLIERIVVSLRPFILHLGASTDLLTPEHVWQLKKKFELLCIARSIPVVDKESVSIVKSYDGIADILLLDSHRPGDTQIGALGVTHNWKCRAVTLPESANVQRATTQTPQGLDATHGNEVFRVNESRRSWRACGVVNSGEPGADRTGGRIFWLPL